jgi:uncharacterized protein (DUF1330 family)
LSLLVVSVVTLVSGNPKRSKILVLLPCKAASAFLFWKKGIKLSKGYWVSAHCETKDQTKLAMYAQLAVPAVEAAGGKVILRGVACAVREHSLKEQTVVIEFPSYEQAVAAYESDAYQKALEALGDSVVRDLRVISGAE